MLSGKELYVRWMERWDWMPSQPRYFYRRSFLEEFGIRHHETPGASYQDNGFFWQTFMHARRAMFIDTPYYLNRRDNPNSSVKDRGKVYAMNVEYAYIRNIFLRPENAQKW